MYVLNLSLVFIDIGICKCRYILTQLFIRYRKEITPNSKEVIEDYNVESYWCIIRGGGGMKKCNGRIYFTSVCNLLIFFHLLQ